MRISAPSSLMFPSLSNKPVTNSTQRDGSTENILRNLRDKKKAALQAPSERRLRDGLNKVLEEVNSYISKNQFKTSAIKKAFLNFQATLERLIEEAQVVSAKTGYKKKSSR